MIVYSETRGERFSGEPFWDEASETLISALIACVYYRCPRSQWNIHNIVELLNLGVCTSELGDDEMALDVVPIIVDGSGNVYSDSTKNNKHAAPQWFGYNFKLSATAREPKMELPEIGSDRSSALKWVTDDQAKMEPEYKVNKGSGSAGRGHGNAGAGIA